MTAPPPLKILHLEDSESDATLVREMIQRAGLRADIHRAKDGPAFERALATDPEPDLILCDYDVPVMRGPAILERARLLRPDTPVVFVSAAVGEQPAVELLRQGAADFVSKDNLERLPLAIRRAMDDVRDRRLQREAEDRYRLTVESCPDALITISHEGIVLEWNPQAERTFGWTRGEVVGRPLPDGLVPERYRDASGTALRRLELTALRRDGRSIPVEVTVCPLQGGAGYSAFVRDLSERKRIEEQLLESRKMEGEGRGCS